MHENRTRSARQSWIQCILFGLVISLLLVFGLAPAGHAQSYRLESWMGDLKSVLNDRPINQIAMVGSHDAGTYKMLPAAGWCGSKDFQFGIIPAAALDPISPFLWKTQTMPISSQLENGVRMFDFRVCFDKVRNEWKFYHGFWTGKNYLGPMSHAVEPELDRIANYAKSHPSEIMIFYIRKLEPYNGGNSLKRDLHQMITQKFGNLIARKQDGLGPKSRYREFIAKGKNVIFIDDGGVLASGAGLSPGTSPYWPAGDEGLSLQDSNNKIVDAPTLEVIADRTGNYISGRAIDDKFQFVSAFPPADNKKYYGSVLMNLYGSGLLANASSRFLNVDILEGLNGLNCPAGARLDPRNGGECWQCPAGFDRTVFPVNGANACERRTPETYSRARYDGKPTGVLGPLSPKTTCRTGAVLNVGSGNCYRCPARYNFTAGFEVGDAGATNACMLPASVQPARSRRLGPARNDRYFDPAFSFIEIGRRLNLVLSNRFRGPWKQRGIADKVNVIVVDNVGLTPGEPIGDIYKMLTGNTSDASFIRSVIEINQYKSKIAPARRVSTSPPLTAPRPTGTPTPPPSNTARSGNTAPVRTVTPQPRPRPTPVKPRTAVTGNILRNPSSGLCLDSEGTGGTAVMASCVTGKASQIWILTTNAEIKNPGSSLCLDASGSVDTAVMRRCSGRRGDQRWVFNRSTGELKSPWKGRCLDSFGRIGNAIMNACHKKMGNQQWSVVSVSNN